MSSVDSDALEQLARVGGPEFVASMIDVAVTTMTDQVAELTGAADAGDAAGVERAAHALISSAGSVGALRVCESARAIEASARSGVVDPAAPEISTLAAELRGFRREVAEVSP